MTEDKAPATAGSGHSRFFYGYVIVGIAFLVMLVMFGTYYSFGVFLKPIQIAYGWERGQTAGAITVYMVAHATMYIFVGPLCDRLGPRLVVTVCGIVLGVGYLLMSQVTAIWQLYGIYGVFIAFGMCGSTPPIIATISRWFVKRRGLVAGIVLAGSGLGTALMAPIATRLINAYDWQFSYIIIGAATLVLLPVAAQFLRANPERMGQVAYGSGETREGGLNIQSIGLSLREAIRTRQFAFLCVVGFCFTFFMQIVMTHLFSHATDTGIPKTSAANIVLIIGLGGIVGRVFLGIMGDRLGNKRLLVGCFMVIVAAFLLPVFAQEVWRLYLFAAIFGITYGGLVVIMSVFTAELFGLAALGSILGISLFIATLGGAVGPWLGGRIFDITGSYTWAFLICIALAVVAMIFSVMLKPIATKGEGR
ncbi:MFS transporter [Chloroflexota bacterium]